MAQTKSLYVQEGDDIDYTPSVATTAGTVVVLGTNLIGITKLDIAASTLGAIGVKGVFKVPKSTGAIARGDGVYWAATGTPVTGDSASGAASTTSGGNTFMGTAVYAAASGDSYVYVDLNSSGAVGGSAGPVSTVAAAGAAQANAANTNYGFNLVTAGDGAKGVILPTPQPGRTLTIRNANNGGALKVYPHIGGTINEAAANTNYALANFTDAIFYPYNSTAWYTLPLVAS